MPKRKLTTASDGAEDATLRRSSRQRTSTSTTNSAALPAPASTHKAAKAKEGRTKVSSQAKGPRTKNPSVELKHEEAAPAPAPTPKGTQNTGTHAKKAHTETDTDTDTANGTTGLQYWLMKAEPETRYENGVDVSFSIDDLAAKTTPEPWDGIRNYVARNNLRAMKVGDLAFFSHSNCKEPGIVGVMEIVREHEPDLSAHDPKSAYHDPKSTAAAPKWSVVHVEFRRKFAAPVTLKEMRAHGGPGGPLEGMQMMKQSRLSVSRVSGAEWDFLMGLAEAKAKEKERESE